MLNKLSPLHEAKIVPEYSGEPMHLVPMHMNRVSSSSRRMKSRVKSKSKGNRRKKHVK